MKIKYMSKYFYWDYKNHIRLCFFEELNNQIRKKKDLFAIVKWNKK